MSASRATPFSGSVTAASLALGRELHLGVGAAVRLHDGDRVLRERRKPALARERGLDRGREPLRLPALALGLLLVELGHHLPREQLEALADVLVTVPARLLDEHDLVDARLGHRLEVRAHAL